MKLNAYEKAYLEPVRGNDAFVKLSNSTKCHQLPRHKQTHGVISINATSITPNNTKVSGVISEKWQANVCGQERTFFPILSPDGQGGYLVAFGE